MVAILAWMIFHVVGLTNIGKGFLLGTLFSIINFILMGQTIPLQLMKSKRKTFAISLSSIFLRYFILAIPLFVAIRSDRFNLYATIIGIFSIQIMILLDQLKMLPCFIRNRRV